MRGFSSTLHELGEEGAEIAERTRELARELEPFTCDFELEPLDVLWFACLRVSGMGTRHTFREMHESPYIAAEQVFAAARAWIDECRERPASP